MGTLAENESAYLIGECGPRADTIPDDEYGSLQRVGIAYIIHILGEPPPGCRLDVIWAQHASGPFQCIALVFIGDPPASAERYSFRAQNIVWHFSANVQWERLTRQYLAGSGLNIEPGDLP